MTRARGAAIAILLGSAPLAGCGADGPLTPLTVGGSAAGTHRGAAPGHYTVRRGETLGGIAARFGLEPTEIARLNRLGDPNQIRVGQVLRMPGGEPRAQFAPQPPIASVTPNMPQAPAPAVVQASQASTQPFSRSVSVMALEPPPAQSPESRPPRVQERPVTLPAAAPPAAVPPATAAPDRAARNPLPPATGTIAPGPNRDRRPGRLSWPVQGQIISDYGTKEGGLHNDGINIAAPRGAAVRAADDGVVAYVGNELRGFGHLILVRHENGWVTAYAHLDQTLARRGDTVSRGQKIGTVGSTGSITSPQLHFEVRRGNRAADPREFLEPRSGVSKAASLGVPPDPG